MAFPVIVINNSTGDNANSGAGPGDGTTAGSAITGTSASFSVNDVTLDGSPDLSAVATDGSHVLYLVTDSGRKFFTINAVDNSTKVVTVDDAPAGTATGLTWAIGGKRETLVGSTALLTGTEIKGGWTIDIEHTGTDYASTTDIGISGSGSTTGGGYARLISSSSSRPVISNTFSSSGGSTINTFTISGNHWYFENLEIVRARGAGSENYAIFIADDIDEGHHFYNCYIHSNGDQGGAIRGNNGTGTKTTLTQCTLVGVSDSAVDMGAGGVTPRPAGAFFSGCHFIGGNEGVRCENNQTNVFIGCIFDGNTRGIYLDNSDKNESVYVINCTFYNCTNGIQADASNNDSGLQVVGCIFDSCTSYALNLTGVNAQVRNNVFHNMGVGITDVDINNMAAYSGNVTTDPGLVDPANDDFTLDGTGSANELGWPNSFGDLGLTGYRDAGAIQRQTGAGGGVPQIIRPSIINIVPG